MVTTTVTTTVTTMNDAGSYPPELAVGVTSDRITTVSPAARAVHKRILKWFATHGNAPTRDELAAVASGHELDRLLAELHDRDVIRLADNGDIRAAYPFSAVPTTHVVAIDGGPAVFSMCAVDALGMAAMLDRDITIESRDPYSGDAITVTVHDGHASWVPAAGVVFVGSQAKPHNEGSQGCCPPDDTTRAAAAGICCHVMNFFADTANAHAWRQANPTVSGHILSQQQALRLGNDIFGRLLRD